MTQATGTAAKKTTHESFQASVQDPGQNTALDCRYHQIGISAVVAAARYHGMAKNPAYAPVQTHWHDVSEDAAG